MAQVNLDFESEADMVEKMRIGIALQPLATALFANSPFKDGKDTGGIGMQTKACMSKMCLRYGLMITCCADRVPSTSFWRAYTK